MASNTNDKLKANVANATNEPDNNNSTVISQNASSGGNSGSSSGSASTNGNRLDKNQQTVSGANQTVTNTNNVNNSLKTVYKDTDLSSKGQADVQKAKQGYNDAKAKGDTAGQTYWRDYAQRAANREGYYRSDDGSEMYKLDQDYFTNTLEPYIKNRWNEVNSAGDKTGAANYHDWAEEVRNQFGYSGGANGSAKVPVNSQGEPDYSGMNYSDKYAAAKAAGDTYGMAEAAHEAYTDRYNRGYYGGADGTQKIPIAPVMTNINELNAQLQDAYSRGDNEAVTQLTRQINALYDSIGMVQADDGNVYAKTELQLRIEQDKRDWSNYYNRGDYAGADRAHRDAVWCDLQLGNTRNADGSSSSPVTYNTVSASNNQNGMIQARVGPDGKPVAVIGNDGNVDYNYRGILYTDNGTANKQYIVTTGANGQQVFVPVSGTITEFYAQNPDGSINQASFTDADGNVLNASNFVFGEDGYSYDIVTGKNLNELASQYGLNPQNFIMRVTGIDGKQNFYNIQGVDVSGRMNTAQRGQIGDFQQATLNDLLSSALESGYNNTPRWEDYDSLSWDQALAMAEEQVNGAFNDQLDKKLSQLNTSALQTGFYGQLPTEQLRQNAMAESEVERQQAIYELANQLQANSQTEAQRQFADSMETSQQRLNVIMTIFQNVYQLVRDTVADKQQQQSYELQKGNQEIQRQANALTGYQIASETIAAIVQAIAQPSEFGSTAQAATAFNLYNVDYQKMANQILKNLGV